MAIPAPLIPPLRSALIAAGFPGETISNSGELNPAGLLAASYNTIEFKSSATPTITIQTGDLLKESKPNPLIQWLRPTVVLTGPNGSNVIAPYGVSEAGSILPLIAVVLGIGFLGFVVGRLSAK